MQLIVLSVQHVQKMLQFNFLNISVKNQSILTSCAAYSGLLQVVT